MLPCRVRLAHMAYRTQSRTVPLRRRVLWGLAAAIGIGSPRMPRYHFLG
jgi:hypothetical protein